MRRAGGYLLVETIVAMGVLSVSTVTMHAAIRQAILARGQAQDYTTARFVLEEVAARMELEYQLVEGQGDGVYEADPRFTYTWEVTTVSVPQPPLPPEIPEVERQNLEKFFTGEMPKVTIRVAWNRAGFDYEAVGETLFGPEKLWRPEPPPA